LNESAAAGDDGVFVPVVHFDECAEFGAVGDVAHELFFGEAGAFDDLAAPGEDAHGRVFGIELAGPIAGAGPEIGLWASEHPIKIHGADVGGNVRWNVGKPRNAGFAAVLKAAAAGAFNFDFAFEREVFGDHVAVHQVAVAAGVLGSGFADDGAVFDSPEFRIAVPTFEADAVEEGDVGFVFGEVDGLGESEGDVGEVATEGDDAAI